MAQPVETATDYIRNHFERPSRWTLYNVFKTVPDLCFIGLLLYLAKPSTIIEVEKWHLKRWHTDRRTDGRYQTYYLPCFAVDKHNLSLFDLELWPTTLPFNPNLA